ncbi:MAG: dTDP-4-dehydrorhamnose reductase [Prolixibacteraceae bacterium]
MKILITGAYGQLGNELKELAPRYSDFRFLFTDADTLDITDNKAIQSYFEKYLPDFVINCAAYTAVDKAETDAENARFVNAVAPGFLAGAAKKQGAGIIYISTDYVFDGKNYVPYSEEDPVNPKAVYGKTKLEGEQKCMAANSESVIIRTSWLYSSFGHNFVKTMLRVGKEKGAVNVVFDQLGTPTYAGDLAQMILTIAVRYAEKRSNLIPGIYHYSNEGAISWFDFAHAVFEIAGINCKINPIFSKELNLPAPRPPFSVLDKSKIKNTYDLEIPYWKESLKVCLEKLKNTNNE